ncbi:hypothetical protein CGLO_02723 [Colletotrichum gloeosporioides Cg-14]|uniref:Uncharacterized protein n=1 Tax=Colletotrichum gloeosporioides (strain Cg-14) TaxID=1237896 RepID=T0M878_COLGC|nr:hypothetical protein CGLO_02723 [Colletotrichum gloeosporioides Cg-14]
MKSVPEHTSRWCNPITILALLLRKKKSKNEQVESIDTQAEDVSMRQIWGSATSFPVETADTPQPGGSVASCLGQQAVSPTLAVPNPRAEAHPWEINFDRNIKHSKILRLPEELLLEVMRAVATDDLYSQHFTVGMKESGV